MSESKKNKDSMRNVIVVSLLICFACSVVVSSAAVLLKPQRIANKELDKNKNILEAAGLYDRETAASNTDIPALFSNFEIHLVDLQEKHMLSESEALELGIDVRTFDQRKASKDPSQSKALSTQEDIASISRRARYSVIYLLRDQGEISKAVVPIHGYGLWSTLYGFVALEADMNTVSGITFYEHGETAGLGGEVDNPKWKGSWPGKKIYDGDKVGLKVIKGVANPSSQTYGYEIDGLSGATITSRGVENLVSYWMGKDGFGPVLDEIKG